MKIFVRAKASAAQEKVEQIDETHFKIAVKEPPRQGKANYAILKALAVYLGVKIWQLKLVSGFTAKNKIFEISDI